MKSPDELQAALEHIHMVASHALEQDQQYSGRGLVRSFLRGALIAVQAEAAKALGKEDA